MFVLKICPNTLLRTDLLLVPHSSRLTFHALPVSQRVTIRISIHFVVASDIEQDNFSLAHTKRQGNVVSMRDTQGMKSFEFPAERMQPKRRQKGIGFEIS